MRFVHLLWLLPAVACAQQTPQPTRVDLWKQDIGALVQALRQNHPAATARISSAELDQFVAELGDKVITLPDYGVVMELARLTASIGDPGTTFPPFQAGVGMRAFPLRVRRFGSGWYVTDASPRLVPLLGRRLASIQGLPVEAILDLVRPFFAADNDSWVSVQAGTFLVSPEVLAHLGLLADRNATAEYEFEDGNGARQTVNLSVEAATLFSLARGARGTVPLAYRNRGLFYWFDYLEAERTLYIKYDVGAQDPTLAIRDFVREITEFAASRRPAKLVIDFRDNTGGDLTVTELLFTLLQQAQASGALPPAQQSFGIISRSTFASGSAAALQWKKTGARLVGETAGGRPHHYGGLRLGTLPATRLLLQYATTEVMADDGDLNPDIAVPLTLNDYRSLRDPVLDAILAL